MGRPKTMYNPTSMHVRLSEQVYEELLGIAESRGMSVSALARWILLQYVNSEKENKHE
jgi:hypothetical protein